MRGQALRMRGQTLHNAWARVVETMDRGAVGEGQTLHNAQADLVRRSHRPVRAAIEEAADPGSTEFVEPSG